MVDTATGMESTQTVDPAMLTTMRGGQRLDYFVIFQWVGFEQGEQSLFPFSFRMCQVNTVYDSEKEPEYIDLKKVVSKSKKGGPSSSYHL